jgi:hypothetical protein
LTKPTARALLFFLKGGLGLSTLATGLILVSEGRPADAPAPREQAFSAVLSRDGFVELHPAVALVTVILVVFHLLLDRQAIYSYSRAAVWS